MIHEPIAEFNGGGVWSIATWVSCSCGWNSDGGEKGNFSDHLRGIMIQQRRDLSDTERQKGIQWLNRALGRLAMRHNTYKAQELAVKDYADYAAMRIMECCKDLLLFN